MAANTPQARCAPGTANQFELYYPKKD